MSLALVIVGVGWFGGRPGITPAPSVAPRPLPSAVAIAATGTPIPPLPSASVPTPAPSAPRASIPHGVGPSAPPGLPSSAPVLRTPEFAYIARDLGYRVRTSDSPGEQVQVTATGRIVQFIRSRISLAARGYGTIRVEVGTPTLGAYVPTPTGDGSLVASTLDAADDQFRALTGARVSSRESVWIGAHAARLLEVSIPFNGAQLSVALTTFDGRLYLIAADGFNAGSPRATAVERRAALLEFLDRLEWTAPT